MYDNFHIWYIKGSAKTTVSKEDVVIMEKIVTMFYTVDTCLSHERKEDYVYVVRFAI